MNADADSFQSAPADERHEEIIEVDDLAEGEHARMAASTMEAALGFTAEALSALEGRVGLIDLADTGASVEGHVHI